MKTIRIWLILVVGLLLVSCNGLVVEQPADEPTPGVQQIAQTAPTATLERQPTARESVVDAMPATPTPMPAPLSSDADAVEALLINVYERVSPAVVHIQITGGTSSILGQRSGAGSGFVLDKDGHIITNNHVIEEAEQIRVSFVDGTQADAQVLGTDPAIDLAVIQVDVGEDVLVPVELGNSDALRIGQRAIAIGNPFGQFDQSMTVGIISALGRTLDPTEEGEFVPELIQTDAAINPGNSGGPLLDSHGRVVGINTLIFSGTGTSVGVGFAVPVNTLRQSLSALLEGRQRPDS